MESSPLRIGQHVTLSATCTGFGFDIKGYIANVEYFAGVVYYEIGYLQSAPDGTHGKCVVNPGFITPDPPPQPSREEAIIHRSRLIDGITKRVIDDLNDESLPYWDALIAASSIAADILLSSRLHSIPVDLARADLIRMVDELIEKAQKETNSKNHKK